MTEKKNSRISAHRAFIRQVKLEATQFQSSEGREAFRREWAKKKDLRGVARKLSVSSGPYLAVVLTALVRDHVSNKEELRLLFLSVAQRLGMNETRAPEHLYEKQVCALDCVGLALDCVRENVVSPNNAAEEVIEDLAKYNRGFSRLRRDQVAEELGAGRANRAKENVLLQLIELAGEPTIWQGPKTDFKEALKKARAARKRATENTGGF